MPGIAKRMALVTTQLHDGTANTMDTLYVSPAETKTLIHNIILHNTHNRTVTAELFYVTQRGTQFQMYNVTMEPNETLLLDYIGEGDVFEAGDKLKGFASVTGKINIKVCGTQET